MLMMIVLTPNTVPHISITILAVAISVILLIICLNDCL
jgi:hypothetical protein